MARARPIDGLTPATPFHEAAAQTVRVRAAEVFELAGGVLDTGDIERVHDMRVATRRLRAVLEVYKPCFPKPPFKRALREVKDLADALGARRDPDVALATVDAIAAQLPPVAQAGVEAVREELRADQAEGNLALERALGYTVESQLEARLLELAASAEDVGSSFGDAAQRLLDERRARVRKLGDRGTDPAAVAPLHKARIAAKRLRYLSEISPQPGKGAKAARHLQDLLGDIHDCDVMSDRIRARAAAVAVADDRYVGLEALASYLDAKRRVLHRQYVAMWAEIEL
jgi:CHAD domain-containing protein